MLRIALLSGLLALYDGYFLQESRRMNEMRQIISRMDQIIGDKLAVENDAFAPLDALSKQIVDNMIRQLCQDVIAASRGTGERVWRLPLDEDYKEQLKSNVADLKNVGGKHGGAITAAKFLETFVGDTAWVHLDIAGPSWADADTPTRDAGGTGCFVRTLVALIESTLGGTAP